MKVLQLLLAAAFAAAAPLAAQAQQGHAAGKHKAAGETHAHGAPHGGVVRTAGVYHLELVQQAAAMHVYLLDGKEATMATTGTTGSVMLLTTTGKTSTVTLTPAGDYLVARVPVGTTVRTAIVSLKVGGKSLSARFEKLDAAAQPGKAAAAAYTCPMRCEGSASAKPGSCPKCGMALVKNS